MGTILLVVFEANRSNEIVEFVLDVGRFLAGPFKDMFNLDNAKTEVAVNYGLAAVVYVAVAGLITRLLVSPLRRYCTPSRSTTKISVSPPLMVGRLSPRRRRPGPAG